MEQIESAAGKTERPESKTKQASAQRHCQVYILLPLNKEIPQKTCRQIIADPKNSLVIALMTLNNPQCNEQQEKSLREANILGNINGATSAAGYLCFYGLLGVQTKRMGKSPERLQFFYRL